MQKVVRTATIPLSLNFLLKGQLKFLAQYFEVTAVSGNGKDLEEVKNREGVATYGIEMQRQIAPFNDLVSLWKLYQYFKKEKPQIVHSITPKAGLLSMTAAYFAGVPVRMHTFTGLIFPSKTGVLQKILILMDKMLCRFATHIFPEGEGVKKDLEKFKITRKPLKVLANGNVNGLDVEYFNPANIVAEERNKFRQELGFQETDCVFIFVGRLVTDKGINELVLAFDQISLEKNNVKLLLVGSQEPELDPLMPKTLKLIYENRNIVSVGFQSDVRKYLAVADALAFPSYREGFPNVVLQAGSMGLPSIVTDISGCNEIIEQDINGIIIPSKSESALFLAMKLFAENDTLRSQMASNSRSLIVNRFTQEIVWNALLHEYQTAIKDV